MLGKYRKNGEYGLVDAQFFTGLYDKNGEEIYQGDRLKIIVTSYPAPDCPWDSIEEEIYCGRVAYSSRGEWILENNEGERIIIGTWDNIGAYDDRYIIKLFE